MSKNIELVAILGLVISLAMAGQSDQLAVIAVFASMILMAGLAIIFIRYSGDTLHPMALLISAWLLRTGIPALLLMAGEGPQMPSKMNWAEPRLWVPGFHLGAVGCFSVALGFVYAPTSRRPWGRLSEPYRDEGALRQSAIAVMLTGVALVTYYLLRNFGSVGGVVSALNSGILRSADEFTISGTTRYSFLGKQCLLWGSVIWGLCERQRRRSVARTVAPSIVAFLFVIPFGGRIVAIAPVVIVTLVWWYDQARIRGFPSVRPAMIVRRAMYLLVALLIFIYMGMLTRAYRGGGGVEALTQAFSEQSLGEELMFSVWNEGGFLHPLAYAVKLGPGTFDPPLGRLIFGGYSAHLLGYDSEKPGEVIVTKLFGVDGWGIHTGVVVDLYLWKGLLSAIGGCLVLGALLKVAYIRLAREIGKPVYVAAYAYFFWSVFWAMFETIVGFPATVLEGAAVLVAIIIVANGLSNRQGRFHGVAI